MATIKWYSDDESFLQGVETGIEHAGDSAIEVIDLQPSDVDEYEFMLVVNDRESAECINKFFNGSSLDYQREIEEAK